MDKQRVFQFYARIVKLIQSKLVSDGLRYNDMLTNGDMWRSDVMCHYWWCPDQYKESHQSPGWVGMIKWERRRGHGALTRAGGPRGSGQITMAEIRATLGHYNVIRLPSTLLSQCQLFPSQQSSIHFWILCNDSNEWCLVTPLLLWLIE